jgi:hypothetical protein
MTRATRRGLVAVVGAAMVVVLAYVLVRPFPPDTTPEGAYMRIAKAVAESNPQGMFAYLETEAQWASYTVQDARKKAVARLRADYPADVAEPLLREYAPLGDALDGPAAFAVLAEGRGWIGRLRRDLSGIAKVDLDANTLQASARATVVTQRGTRYAFRRRDNGIWGLTLFTVDLMAEAERASRDLKLVERAADDYARGKR